jgi:hypothetical protein
MLIYAVDRANPLRIVSGRVCAASFFRQRVHPQCFRQVGLSTGHNALESVNNVFM